MSKHHNICSKCRRIFSLDSSKSDCCAPCSDIMQMQKTCVPNKTCSSCHERFYTPNGLKICQICHQKGSDNFSRDPKKYDPNKKYTPPNNGNRVPIEELIRRQEWKRVMEDDGWDHYLRGRKWDKI